MQDTNTTEAECLEDSFDIGEDKDDFQRPSFKLRNIISMYKARYNSATKAKVGFSISCPRCGKKIIKNTYNKRFCSSKCKDKYWNTVEPSRFRCNRRG